MSGNPTHGQLIQELTRTTTRFEVLIDGLADDVEKLNNERVAISSTLADLQTQVAVNETLLHEARTDLEEGRRRWYALLPPIVGGIIGALLTLVINLLINALKSP